MDLHYTCEAIRGWPKLIVEVWGEDSFGRNSIAGYGMLTFPLSNGDFKLEIDCWTPLACLRVSLGSVSILQPLIMRQAEQSSATGSRDKAS